MATCSSAMGITAAATSSVSALTSSSSTTRAASAKIVVRAPVAILSRVSLKRGEITLRSSQRDTSASDGRTGVFRHGGGFPVEGTRRAKRSPVASAEPAVSNSETAGSSTIDVVRQVISEQLAVKLSELEPTSKFADLGADSLDTVEIMMKLEEKFGITMEEDGTEKIATVQDAATLIDQIKDK